MTDTLFGTALTRLWPNGDERVPGLRAGMIATAPAVFAKYAITTPRLVAHVMAQGSHECGAGHDMIENLNYSAQRMPQVWPSRFASAAAAAPYAHNPQKLANKVYNGRMGNGSGSDDGWNFRGRGFCQTTGRYGYDLLSRAFGLPVAALQQMLVDKAKLMAADFNAKYPIQLDLLTKPDLLIDPTKFLEAGVADFVLCGCLPYAVKDDVFNVTKHLNGGTVGLAQRKVWLAQWKKAMGAK